MVEDGLHAFNDTAIGVTYVGSGGTAGSVGCPFGGDSRDGLSLVSDVRV